MGLRCQSPNFQAEEFSFNAVYVVSFSRNPALLLHISFVFMGYYSCFVGGKDTKKLGLAREKRDFFIKKLTEWEISCNFAAPEPAKPLNDAQMCGSFYFRM